MKRVSLLLLAVVLAGCARDHFALIDLQSGREVGRFAYRTGERLALGGKTYQIRQVGSHASATEQYLQMTIVPEVDMCQAYVGDVVCFLSDCVKEFGPTNIPWATPLPNIQLDLSATPKADIPWITIRGVHDLSLWECLQRVCHQGDLRLVIDRQYVWLRPRKKDAQQDESTVPSKAAPSAPSDVR